MHISIISISISYSRNFIISYWYQKIGMRCIISDRLSKSYDLIYHIVISYRKATIWLSYQYRLSLCWPFPSNHIVMGKWLHYSSLHLTGMCFSNPVRAQAKNNIEEALIYVTHHGSSLNLVVSLQFKFLYNTTMG